MHGSVMKQVENCDTGRYSSLPLLVLPSTMRPRREGPSTAAPPCLPGLARGRLWYTATVMCPRFGAHLAPEASW
jgi:hypothetical protein